MSTVLAKRKNAMCCSWSRLRRRCLFYLKRYSLVMFWTGINSLVFWTTYNDYKRQPEHYYLHRILGSGLCLSRATAAVLNFNCFVIVLPMCRTVTSIFRSIFGGTTIKSIQIWIEIGKSFHILCAVTIVIAAVIHSAAHVVNAHNFSQYYNPHFPEINMASYKYENPFLMIIRSVPGITGLCMIVILFLLITSSLKRIRTAFYNLFWFTHRLFILFLLLLFCHPMGRNKVTLIKHVPGCIPVNATLENLLSKPVDHPICKEAPVFVPQSSETWKWIVAALVVYGIDVAIRLIRRCSAVQVLALRIYGGSVLELRLLKAGFRALPGQYVLLQCPAISSFEWHPFTVSSCPTEKEPSFTLHIRTKGDWSYSLQRHLLEEMGFSGLNIKSSELLVNPHRHVTGLYVDGPFCSNSESVRNYEISICIAGGIGVTPFVSILTYLRVDGNVGKMQRLHFIWVCREIETFLWFADLLCDLHRTFWDKNKPDFLDIQLYLTCPSIGTIVRGMIGEQYGLLEARLHIGRPKWKKVFRNWTEIYEKIRVGVFCCGPRSLSRQVGKVCKEAKISGGTFVYHKESFS
ncbi:NADPH oxidase 4-like [Centruroides vittatus]|uniref:NADPH oxidase 4-like n=1 Tax=Centruroides vittatus TaxID=120091 RepID=UPI003510C420